MSQIEEYVKNLILGPILAQLWVPQISLWKINSTYS